MRAVRSRTTSLSDYGGGTREEWLRVGRSHDKNTDGAPRGAISGADRAADLGTALLE